MEKNNEKINKSILVTYLFYILLFFPLLCENILSTCISDDFSKMVSLLSCIIIVLMILKRGKIKIGIFEISMIILILLRCVILFFLAPNNLIITTKNNMITPYGLIAYLVIFLFINSSLNDKKRLKYIFTSMFYVMTIGVFMNIIFNGDLSLANNVSVFKEAITTKYTNSRVWLFGHRNMIFVHHLIWILTGYISCRFRNKKYSKLFLFQSIITILVGILSWNSTMMLCTILLFVLYVFRNKPTAKLVYNNYLLIYLFLEIGIVFFQIQKYFEFIIVSIFHRSLSFTGRTAIWSYYIENYMNFDMIHKLIGNYGITELTVNSHNMFLGLLSFTGIIGLLFYLIMLFISHFKLREEKDTELASVISIVIFAFLINALTMEFYIQPLIAVYLGYIVKKINVLFEEERGYYEKG